MLQSSVSGSLDGFLKQLLFISCKTSYFTFWMISVSIPELLLYPVTFYYIAQHTKKVAKSGMLTQVNRPTSDRCY